VYDTTRFVKVSIREVSRRWRGDAAGVPGGLLFLQNWRATLIPLAAVPVSLIGTFAGLYLLGYSINTLTLFGMVLAIGIVVDDAIVVLENVERIMHEEQGLGRARRPSRRCARSPARSSPSCWCCARCSCRSLSSAA
jgi:multidrug efflux pump